ncbi:MAG: response regulator, partial [Proteobacteria bacterium]
DSDIRSALGDLINTEGHQVVEADSFESAKLFLLSNPGIDLVITSLALPDCVPNGEIVEKIRLIRSEISIIISSSSQTLLQICELYQVAGIKKPFLINQLLELIDSL